MILHQTMEEYEQELLEEGFEEGTEKDRKLLKRSVKRWFQKAPRWVSQWLKQQKELPVLEQCLDHVLDAKDLQDLKQRILGSRTG